MFSNRVNSLLGASLSLSLGTGLYMYPSAAEACGCFSPPVPESVSDADFAVNQQAEQIIFEKGEGTVTAHVLIRYSGDPKSFAWLLPIPNVVELGITEPGVFGVLQEQTSALVNSVTSNRCPSPEYICDYHPECPSPGEGNEGGGDDGDGGELPEPGGSGAEEGGDSDGSGELPGGVEVELETTVGDYDVVVFNAEEAGGTVQWLQDNGFIVNDTMAPYMQPYLDKGMMFLAAKLVTGAGADAVKPLKMTYEGEHPMIPLQLTAVAAEPHMPVVAYIYGDDFYKPAEQSITKVNEDYLLHSQSDGSSNYPAALSRSIDDAGGDAFVVEFASNAPEYRVDDPGDCCSEPDSDWCGVGNDGQCQCPGSEFDQSDCENIPGLIDGINMMADLAYKHEKLTRLVTRLSPEDMSFDPMFEPDPSASAILGNRLRLQGYRYTLQGCEDDVMDQARFERIGLEDPCSQIYCGEGVCGVTSEGEAGCVCDDGFVARSYVEYDGVPSVTCVPETGTVDLGVDTELPDVCEGVECGEGNCVAIGGFPSCSCDATATAVLDDGELVCTNAMLRSDEPGANNPTQGIPDIPVCAPKPPECGDRGWLIANPNRQVLGELCDYSTPAHEDTVPPPGPDCDGDGEPDYEGGNDDDGASGDEDENDSNGQVNRIPGHDDGIGCSCQSSGGSSFPVFSLFGFALLAIGRRGRH